MRLASLNRRLVFQFTLPRGERPLPKLMPKSLELFQFTLPRGERQCVLDVLAEILEFQFTLPRGERPDARNLIGVVERVSIHAPARGATLSYVSRGITPKFQFTLPRGERLRPEYCLIMGGTFQFTLPRGERRHSLVG